MGAAAERCERSVSGAGAVCKQSWCCVTHNVRTPGPKSFKGGHMVENYFFLVMHLFSAVLLHLALSLLMH